MVASLVLASRSPIRRTLLENAGVAVEAHPARIDEDSLRAAMKAEGVTPRNMADHLAEAKARKQSGRMPGRLVLGCDQVLEHRGKAIGKAAGPEALRAQLQLLRGDGHVLWSAAVLYRDGAPVWREIGEAQMTMADFSDTYLDDYLARNGSDLEQTVGGYMVEGEGLRLFARIDGDYFTILGLPLLPVLRQLGRMGEIET